MTVTPERPAKSSLMRKLSLRLTLLREVLTGGFALRYHLVLGGHIHFQTLATAVQFDLFSLLDASGPLTQAEIQQKLGIAEQPCRILLLGLVALHFLRRSSDGRYSNRTVAKRYFTTSSKRSIVNIVKWQHFINYRAMQHYYDAVRTGTNVGLKEFPGDEPYLYGRLVHQPQLQKIFQDAMQEISAQASAHFATYVDLSGVSMLVDVGGGNGSNIITIARANPHLKAGVFDSPSVCAIATGNIASHGLSDRLTTFEGDCFKDSFPKEADALLFCHFFTIWSLEENLHLLKLAYASLPPGGRVMIFNMMQHNDRSGPISSALGSPYFLTLATGKGMLYCWDEYIDLFHKAGFVDVSTQKLPIDHGVIVGYKPR